MNSSQLSEENSDNELFEDFLKLSKNSKKKKKSIKCSKMLSKKKWSLIIKLFELHALINPLKSENTRPFNTIHTLENKLKESEDLLKKNF